MTDSSSRNETEHHGEVVDIVRELLGGRRDDDVISLVTQLVAQNSELAVRAAKASVLETRNAELEKQLEKVLARYKKSEAVSKTQLVLFIDALSRGEAGDVLTDEDDPRREANEQLRTASGIDDDQDEPRTTQPREQPKREPAPAHLPRVENPITVAPEHQPCPRCGKARVCIGHDVTEVIELVPAQVIVRQDKREKLACDECEGELVRAPNVEKVVDGGKYGDALEADILVSKYADGLPLHRQKERYARLGLDMPISTLVDQVKWSTDLLRPLWRAAIAECIASKVMHLDGTGLPVLDRAAPGGKRFGTLWGYVGDDVAAYVFTSTAKAVGQKPGEMGPEDILSLREGFTVADAGSQFNASFATRPNLIECGCNMHARRYYTKALDAGDKRAALPLAGYKRLFEIEDEIRDRDPDGKLAVRVEKSRPVFDELVKWAEVHQLFETPSSKLGDALRYLLNHRVALGRFLESGLVPIDNGAVERLHIRAALARKNFLFAGSDTGGERAAVAFTILGCCRIVGVNPIEYLTSVFPILARRVRLLDLPGLLPARWKARRDAATSG
ncbi:MAG: IS66 family transposase [Deltaproteobacteria bacterium]